MQTAIRFDPKRLPPETAELRAEVRAFLAEEAARGTFDPALGLRISSVPRGSTGVSTMRFPIGSIPALTPS